MKNTLKSAIDIKPLCPDVEIMGVIGIRLFIAINFNEEVKAQINQIIDRVKSNSVQGRFVSEENIHLTLEFLGEVQEHRIGLIREIMDGLEFEPFTLGLTKIGCFRRPEGKIYWLGVEDCHTLYEIQKALRQSLIEKGFKLENREYRPHITLGRKVILKEGFNAGELDDIAGRIKIGVNRIDLMKSDFINRKPMYSLVYSTGSPY
ncbi:MAG: RNA 2',3'-cyclic phosphodiesterase [Clostridiales bacterium]|jgi:2'-5' RNA ligase|nr:RNA 2',3'-cyclic phosphodiesterase [Clostridiales bacterium]HOB37355.1 RNA 2',3'-cyclic phosphodiesterase [Candidatus Avimonas sp.]HQD38823.1 RNA 2',3'-cyclic phosphodiesterase [Candidatus Avimonas sp.]